MRILLMGNPNVGKSAFFSRMTGANVVISNYPGTTVEFTKGLMMLEGKRVEVIDLPGIYTLEPSSRAAEIASKMMSEGDIIINVVDSTNLSRNLNLTLQLLKKGIPMVIALNLWDEAKHTGIGIDVKRLEERLGVPCVPTCALTGEGFKGLISRLKDARTGCYDYEEGERWHEIGRIVEEVETLTHRHHGLRERLADLSIRPLTGIPIAILISLAILLVVWSIGKGLEGYVFRPFFERVWIPMMMRVSSFLGGSGILHDLLIGEAVSERIELESAFGLLTTGLFVPFGIILPYLFSFYLVLSLLEDSGYLPRLAVLTDTILHRLGLHGGAIIPMMLGLGCNVPGILATRIMETNRERCIATTLMAITIPCMAQVSMIIGLLGRYGVWGLFVVFGTLFFVWVGLGLLLNRFLGGESMEIFFEIPPYRIPHLGGFSKKVWARFLWFLRDGVPWLLVGIIIANLLYSTKLIEFIGRFASPVIKGIFGLRVEAVGALLIGFLRKDVAVGMLMPLGLSQRELILASIVLTMYFPCAATFATLLKELGILHMARTVLIMITSTILVGGIINLILHFV